MAGMPDPNETAASMINGVTGAGEKWAKKTADSVGKAIDSAIAAKAKYASGVQAAIADDRYAKGLGKVDRSAMVATIQGGASTRFVSGVTGRQAKIVAALTKLKSVADPVLSAIQAMPTTTADQAKAKMLAMFDGWAKIKKAYRA